MKVFIAGSGLIPVDRYYDLSLEDLAFEAYKSMLGDLKEYPKADAVVVASGYAELTDNSANSARKIANFLGHDGATVFRVESAEGGGSAILTAFSLIKAGLAKSVLLFGVEKLSDQPGKFVQDYLARSLDFKDYISGLVPSNYAALMMKRYMEKYGVNYDYFVNWPVKMHEYASENPLAMLKFRIKPESVKDSQVISEPLRLYDTGARGDGAAAVLLVSEEVARKYGDDLAEVRRVDGSSGELIVDTTSQAMRILSAKLGDSLKNYYLEIHDSYSVTAAIQLEDLGLAERGKSLTELDSLELNFSGGLKARGYPGAATAVYQLAEVYQQLTQKFKGRRTSMEKGLVISSDDLLTVSYGVEVVRA